MKKNLLKSAMLSLCCLLGVSASYSQQIAFPGAEGFGKYAKGPRATSSREVYRVTNLNNSGTGSFRDALSQPGRYIIFDVGGVIKLNSPLVCPENTYIAGQTAPGEGITIYGDGFSFSGASNSICRYIRVRAGVNSTRDDALSLSNGENIIFDHVSVSWGRDETFSVTMDNTSRDSRNITIQNCIISQGLLSHSAGGLCEPNGEITIYRTLFIDNDTRNFRMKNTTHYENNIVYNWSSAAYIMGQNSSSPHYGNAISNYFIAGPNSGSAKNAFHNGNSKYQLYTEDNLVDKNKDGVLNGILVPEEDYVTWGVSVNPSGGLDSTKRVPTFMPERFEYIAVPTIPAADLFDDLIGTVGASLPHRDNLDWFLIDEVKSKGLKGGFITKESELPIGIPTEWNLWGGNGRGTDTDGDGIPDEWETKIGSDPNVSDALFIRDGEEYTNIELYINSIGAEDSQYIFKAPISLKAISVTESKINLEWLEVTDYEDGYIVEQKIGSNFEEVGRVDKAISTYLVENLEPETTYTFRVRGYNTSAYTNYTLELDVKTKPTPVFVTNPDTYVPDFIWTGSASKTWDKITSNWAEGTFVNEKNVLFDETGNDGEITIADGVEIGTVFVKGDKDYSFTGVLAGDSSVNKTGTGKLILPDNNTYKGATVIWDGVMEINKLANGGEASSIGASPNYDFNWVWNGGKIRYTGESISTDRSAAIDNRTEFEVTNSASTVTLTGLFSGNSGFTKSGLGSMYLKIANDKQALNEVNTFAEEVVVKEGILELNGAYTINNAVPNKLVLSGGHFKTSGGSTSVDETYNYDIEVNGETESIFEPYRNCQINSTVSGSGDLKLNIMYVREYFNGDWENYYGTLTVNGIGGSSDGSQFMIYNYLKNKPGMPNARVVMTGNTKAVSWKNTAIINLGGLSGDAGTYLACADKQNNSATVTWKVGALGTDEEFRGIINNECSNKNYKNGKTSIIKEGEGYWRLTGNNIHAGTTTVNQGNLIVNGAHTGTGAITVNASGTLSGKGSVASAVTVKEDGTLDPGDLGIGTFTIKNTLKLEAGSILNIDVDRVAKTNDKISATGALTIDGDLNINIMEGSLVNGDALDVLSADSYTGTFANITPVNPAADLYWDTTDLYTSGVLKVTNVPTGIYDNNNVSELIKVVEKTIVIEGLASEKIVSIYDLSGLLIYSNTVTDSANISVEAGIYFVKVGTKTVKVIVQ